LSQLNALDLGRPLRDRGERVSVVILDNLDPRGTHEGRRELGEERNQHVWAAAATVASGDAPGFAGRSTA
jgi:hypothetical protein